MVLAAVRALRPVLWISESRRLKALIIALSSSVASKVGVVEVPSCGARMALRSCARYGTNERCRNAEVAEPLEED